MIKKLKVVLKLGDEVRNEQWATTKNDFDETVLRYQLKTAVNNVLRERK